MKYSAQTTRYRIACLCLRSRELEFCCRFGLPLLKRAGYKVSIVVRRQRPVECCKISGQKETKCLPATVGALYLSYWLSILTHIQDQQVAFVQFDDIFENPKREPRQSGKQTRNFTA